MIEPALTKEGLAELDGCVDFKYGTVDVALGGQYGTGDINRDRHRLAALCLYGQPFGFTREMLRALKTLLANHIAEDRGRDGDTWYSDELEKLVALGQDTVDRIEALLPPDTPT